MIVLVYPALWRNDPSAAIYKDGKLIGCGEEELYPGDKHAKNTTPCESAQVLYAPGRCAQDIDGGGTFCANQPLVISALALRKRYWYAPDRALDALFNGNRRYRRCVKRIENFGNQLH